MTRRYDLALNGAPRGRATNDGAFAAARETMRGHAHTFYFAARWLPPPRRRATFALYALFRTLDELVDAASAGHRTVADTRAELDGWRQWLHDPERYPRAEPMLPAVRATLASYQIPVRHFLDLIDGLEMDLDGARYATIADLALYCYRVASTVGLAMCSVLDARHPAAAAYAAELGVAMQLTNILRDVGEDLVNGRLYLPADLLAAYGCDERALTCGRPTAELRAVIREMIATTRLYYQRGERGLPFLCRDGRLAIRIAARCYAGILVEIERANYDVLTRRAHVSAGRKLRIAIGTALGGLAPARGPLPPLPGGAPNGPLLLRIADCARTRPARVGAGSIGLTTG